MHCSVCVCFDSTEDYDSAALVIFDNSLVFYFPLSQVQTIISSSDNCEPPFLKKFTLLKSTEFG